MVNGPVHQERSYHSPYRSNCPYQLPFHRPCSVLLTGQNVFQRLAFRISAISDSHASSALFRPSITTLIMRLRHQALQTFIKFIPHLIFSGGKRFVVMQNVYSKMFVNFTSFKLYLSLYSSNFFLTDIFQFISLKLIIIVVVLFEFQFVIV